VREGTPHELTSDEAGGTGGPGAVAPVVSFGGPPGIDSDALAAAVGTGTTVMELTPGRYRVEAGAHIASPAITAAVATFLADRGATLTDLTVGKTLEDVYFETVGHAATPEDPSEGADDTGRSTARGRRGRRSGRRPTR
jgi:hypothetical protein